MNKMILPMYKNMPYVTPDGCLPCPALSTCNALKWLERNKEKMLAGFALMSATHGSSVGDWVWFGVHTCTPPSGGAGACSSSRFNVCFRR